MHVVRESSSGHPASRKEHSSMTSKKTNKKSNWDLMGKGKGSGHLKEDLDLKAPKRPLAVISGAHKGQEKVVKRKTT